MADKIDNYELITNTIVESLEAIENGTLTIPSWIKPWSSIGAPRNAFSNRAYNGINAFMLPMYMSINGWADPRFATFNQIKKEGGNVKKGETGSKVILWQFIKDKQDESKTIPLLKVFTVFNVKAQTEGITLKEITTPNKDERDASLDALFANTKANITHGKSGAFFSPTEDYIGMPAFEAFRSKDAYYATLAHEMIHWTGHKSRLDRNLDSGRFGNEAYAFEELVAELGSAFICQTLGIDGSFQDNHLAYIKSWIKVLKNDKRALFRAQSLAKMAVAAIIPQLDAKDEETEEVAA